MTTTQLPRSIQASIHQDAINRVSEFFNASTTDVLNELLQNARRSGAGRVDITTEEGRITVADDGHGIEDPAAILAFGQTSWEDQAARDEHPAGMGMYALARRKLVVVRSKQDGSAAWQVSLTPDHFVGKLPAPIELVSGNETPNGTAVTFTDERTDGWRIRETARYYPLPVYINGDMVEPDDFLERADHTEEWQGIRLGVYITPSKYVNNQRKSLNFHGIVVREPGFPETRSIDAYWNVQADVLDCSRLELTLPARREVVETPFMEELRRACSTAIYRAMSLQEPPVDVSKSIQQDAAALGINLPDAAPKLEKWDPEDDNGTSFRSMNSRREVDENSIVMDLDLPASDRHALARAAERNGLMERLFRSDRRLSGYGWYDRMTRALKLSITTDEGGGELDLLDARESETSMEDQRPDRITFTLHTEDPDGESEKINLPSDLAFGTSNDDYDNCEEWNFSIMVTRDSSIEIKELAELMLEAFFTPSDDKDADSFETQEYNCKMDYERIATQMLASGDDAVKAVITNAIGRHVIHEIPQGTTATIRIKRGEPIRIDLEADHQTAE